MTTPWKKFRMLIAAMLLAAAVTQTGAEALLTNVSFPDVKSGSWYYTYVQKCAQLGIVNGDDTGYFRPDKTITRGEFITMMACSIEGYTLTASRGVHWAEQYWNICSEYGIFEDLESDIPLTAASLNMPISRYGMSVMVRNMLYNVRGESTVTMQSPEKYIADYSSISLKYQGAVIQSYGKGILNGKTVNGRDVGFDGSATLTKAEAAKVIVCLLWPGERKVVANVVETDSTITPTDSFSWRYRDMTAAERRVALFGDANKTYFTSAADAGSHMTTIKVKTWDINSKTGEKYTRTWDLTVNVVVADEVASIFAEIYSDPSQFPIHSLGGARYSDSMRHSWGCAIDINPVENYYINYSSGATVGSFCYKNNSSNSPFCIYPDSIVVKTFAKYGWGWGGSGWTGSADYMHFSILSSGG